VLTCIVLFVFSQNKYLEPTARMGKQKVGNWALYWLGQSQSLIAEVVDVVVVAVAIAVVLVVKVSPL